MSFEYLADPSRPAWAGLLPGKPEAYFLTKGEGEHAKLFADTFSVLLSGDETDGQFGIFTATCPVGDIIPTHAHSDTRRSSPGRQGARVRPAARRPTGVAAARGGRLRLRPRGSTARYRVEQAGHMMGVASGGFERFFQQMGTPADTIDPDSPPFVPDFPRMQGAAEAHRMQFRPDFTWPDA
jgi:quercetin 2,3-dioxygenase